MVKRGLGKGFESLIPTDVLNSDFDTTAAEDEKVSDLRLLKIDDVIADPDQPRRHFDPDELASLADSIKEHGVLQPLVVTPKGKKYQVVAGERRLRASQLAGLAKVPAIIRTLSSQHRLEISIIENVQRQDLNPMEMATAYLKLRTQFNLTNAEIAQRVGKATSTVANTMRLANLSDNIKHALVDGLISEAHCRQILALDDEEARQYLFDQIIKNKWTVRRAEQFVLGYKAGEKEGIKSVTQAKRALRSETPFTRSLAKKLGFKNKSVIQRTTASGGQIIIKYKDESDMQRISDILGL
ncbi:MAG: ParB/RepB/Spo0J family partition protein [Candidatus Saccharibacteria bacterium]|nr:ParB/RepB/Spo0J family partition protein [Candidatus Saccharibacteria bacterium]